MRARERDMNVWQRWVRKPQGIWLRRALFQIHLWTGLAVGLYMLMISVTGSALVFRAGLNALLKPAAVVAVSGQMMSEAELRAAVEKQFANSRFKVMTIKMPGRPDRAAEISVARGRVRQVRLIDPYSGKDIGDASEEIPFMVSMVDLHDNLLGGDTGRKLNGYGGICLALLCLTGMVIWWPGSGSWRRGLVVKRGTSWKRFNFDLHSMIGFWTFALLFMWAVTSIYFAFPEPFQAVVDYLDPPELRNPPGPGTGDLALEWFGRIHFGRRLGSTQTWYPYFGWLWVVLGLAPSVLLVSGVIMWWQRVIRKRKLT